MGQQNTRVSTYGSGVELLETTQNAGNRAGLTSLLYPSVHEYCWAQSGAVRKPVSQAGENEICSIIKAGGFQDAAGLG